MDDRGACFKYETCKNQRLNGIKMDNKGKPEHKEERQKGQKGQKGEKGIDTLRTE